MANSVFPRLQAGGMPAWPLLQPDSTLPSGTLVQRGVLWFAFLIHADLTRGLFSPQLILASLLSSPLSRANGDQLSGLLTGWRQKFSPGSPMAPKWTFGPLASWGSRWWKERLLTGWKPLPWYAATALRLYCHSNKVCPRSSAREACLRPEDDRFQAA